MNPFELPGDDPLNYGLLQAGGALMAPGGGFGAAASALGKTVSNERQNQIDAQLKKLLIESRRNGLKIGVEEGDPAAWREYQRFIRLSPEEKIVYLNLKRQNEKIYDVGGVATQGNLASGQSRPLTTIDQVSGNRADTQRAIEIEKALRDLVSGTNPVTNRPEMASRESQARALGAPGMPTPTQQREMPPGVTPSQFQNGMSVMELAQRERGIANPFGGPQLPPIQPAPLLPPAAGAPALAAEQAKLTELEKYKAKLREEYPKAKGGIDSLEKTLDLALKQVDRVEKNESGAKWNTGLISNLPVRMIKGTSPFQHDSDLTTLKDQMVIETIKNLKNLSSTGATGFGQMSEREGARLEGAVANLRVGQTGKDLKDALTQIRTVIGDIKKNARATYDREFGEFNPPNDPLGIR
jgi:hypothetical protein